MGHLEYYSKLKDTTHICNGVIHLLHKSNSMKKKCQIGEERIPTLGSSRHFFLLNGYYSFVLKIS